MKNLFNWIGGFFSSESGTSSKRLVGIIGAIALFIPCLTIQSQNQLTYLPILWYGLRLL